MYSSGGGYASRIRDAMPEFRVTPHVGDWEEKCAGVRGVAAL